MDLSLTANCVCNHVNIKNQMIRIIGGECAWISGCIVDVWNWITNGTKIAGWNLAIDLVAATPEKIGANALVIILFR